MSVKDYAVKWAKRAKNESVPKAVAGASSELAGKALEVTGETIGTTIWGSEWDVCLVLDACRADLFAEVATEYEYLPDSRSSKRSVASATPLWINHTFPRDRDLSSIGYVTANPHTGKVPTELPDINPDVYPLREREFAYLDEVWVDSWGVDINGSRIETVHPAIMTMRGARAWAYRERLGMDQLIVHYLQPHVPFRDFPEAFTGWGGTENIGQIHEQKDPDPWPEIPKGKYDADRFWAAYRDNLRWALDTLDYWVEETGAQILITSDHGNGMGEWGVWGHPAHAVTPELRRVPWEVIEGESELSRTAFSKPDPSLSIEDGETEIEDRLAALGYV